MSYYPREKHREMILDPFKWPHLILPIKRFRDGMMETAIVHAGMQKFTEDECITVKLNSTIFGDLPGGSTNKTYKNVDELLDDGWVVD
jgi:hypothetical protein